MLLRHAHETDDRDRLVDQAPAPHPEVGYVHNFGKEVHRVHVVNEQRVASICWASKSVPSGTTIRFRSCQPVSPPPHSRPMMVHWSRSTPDRVYMSTYPVSFWSICMVPC